MPQPAQPAYDFRTVASAASKTCLRRDKRKEDALPLVKRSLTFRNHPVQTHFTDKRNK